MAGWFDSYAKRPAVRTEGGEFGDPVENDYRVPDHIAWVAEPDGSVVLADLRTGRRHSLAPTGGMIWDMSVMGSAPDAIEAVIREAFRDVPEDVRQLIDNLLESLVESGLLERRPYP